MALVTRGDKIYYYKSRRENGRVVVEYVGAGFAAELAAAADRRQKLAHQQEKDRLDEIDQVDQELDQLLDAVDLLITTTLLLDGNHQHRRQWRKRRNEGPIPK